MNVSQIADFGINHRHLRNAFFAPNEIIITTIIYVPDKHAELYNIILCLTKLGQMSYLHIIIIIYYTVKSGRGSGIRFNYVECGSNCSAAVRITRNSIGIKMECLFN